MYNACMSVALQIRNVPEDVRDTLAAHAERDGQSLQTFLLAMLEREAAMLRNAEAFERTAGTRIRIPEHLSPEAIVREGRDAGFTVDRSKPDR